jgi:hypothetical protein
MMGWYRYEEYMGNPKKHKTLQLENFKGRGHMEDLTVDHKIIFKHILKKQAVRTRTGFS